MKPDKQIAQGTTKSETFEEVLSRHIARRSFLKSSLAAVPAALLAPTLLNTKTQAATPDKLLFQPVPLGTQDTIALPAGYSTQVLLRWGDALFVDSPAFDISNLTAEAQRKQFGYNNDFISYIPLASGGRKDSRRGLLFVNHEYTNPELMFQGYSVDSVTKNQVDIELAAHGNSIVEIVYKNGQWQVATRSHYNRRITAETRIEITGPAAGHDWLKTSYDQAGSFAYGTLNNCGGGLTPWGTILTCEENFNQYFANLNALSDSDPRKAIHTRYGLPTGASERRWERFYNRFDLTKEPNEPFKFGWVMEVDPFDPTSTPRKRTALGRLKHEAATSVISKNGLAVIYTGDDERFDYLYKFVSRRPVNQSNRAANLNLLDDGTLYVAKFKDNGTGEWLPLIAGQGALATWSQEEVLLYTRGAGDAIGATKMDRPEDVEVNPVNGKIYGVFTNNTQRATSGRPGTDAANPRGTNRHGHIIEMSEDRNDAAAETFTWNIFLLCGDPTANDTYFAGFDKSKVTMISSPDNITFDKQGNMWITTDGQPGTIQKNDGVYVVPVDGEERGYVRQFLSSVVGSETTGPELTPNNETLFVSIQHPGEGGTFASPVSHFPDGNDTPRPSVVAITKTGSGVIGS
jgi:secreted PhoX family phosphatase